MITKDLMTTDYLKIDKSASVSELIGDIIRTKEKAAVVFDRKKYVGITTKRLLIKTKIDPFKLSIAKVVEKAPLLDGEEDIEEAARLLYASDAPLLAVAEKKQVIGVIRSVDVINHLSPADKRKKIKEIMTLEPITVKEDDRTGKAIEVMKEDRISRIPIVDAKGNLINIVSLTDILEIYHLNKGKGDRGTKNPKSQNFKQGTTKQSGEKVDIDAYPISSLGSSVMITASENDPVSSIIDKMEEYDISSLVIVKDKKPVGIITVRDLLKLFMKDRITF